MMKKKSSGVLSSADWVLDSEELESKFTPKTKMIIVNTPHNPIGKVNIINKLIMFERIKVMFPQRFSVDLNWNL